MAHILALCAVFNILVLVLSQETVGDTDQKLRYDVAQNRKLGDLENRLSVLQKEAAEHAARTARHERHIMANTDLLSNQTDVLAKRVAFYAIKNGWMGENSQNKVLAFETVILNEGGGYDPSGVFTAPHAGVYRFYWTICTRASSQRYSNTQARRNRAALAGAGTFAGPSYVNVKGQHPYYMSSQVVMMTLERGDTFDIIHTSWNSVTQGYSFAQPSFSGFLLYANN